MFANLIYATALLIASPWIIYRSIRHGRYRRGISEKLFGLPKSKAKQLLADSEKCVWIHAVSVGEVNLLPQIVEQLDQRNPDHRIIVSTSTDTGYDLALKHFGNERVFFCPLDFTWAIRRTLRNLNVCRLVLTELELWPNLIANAKRLGCNVNVINARLSEKSSNGYQRCGFLTRKSFARLDIVACQDQTTANNFIACGTPKQNVVITGSMKFDGAPISRDTAPVQACSQWAGIDPWHRVWIFGSTQEGEEQLAIDTYQSIREEHPELRLILVPRHPERFDHVARLVQASGLSVHRRSTDPSLFDSQWDNETVVLIDTVGELRHWWGVCQIATVGGSFGDRGGQNMLEPAGYGSAVSFGPNTRNFKDIANQLIKEDGAVRVDGIDTLRSFVTKCLSNQSAAESLGNAAQKVVNQHRGATERTLQILSDIDSSNVTTKQAA